MEMTRQKMGDISSAILRLLFEDEIEPMSDQNIELSISDFAEMFEKLPKELCITLSEFFVYLVRMLPEKYAGRFEEKIKKFLESQELLADPFEEAGVAPT